ncbi:hypothetical protein O3M35_003716 [Rhynocoris fuscipes]|uniref:DNA-dependent protein kinase catalytic subunit CC3 domain-containing protein n=1 Tax=Rhynocoris fuscipes TaxID=488301 RepID=A0AAW1CH84_9HEMI
MKIDTEFRINFYKIIFSNKNLDDVLCGNNTLEYELHNKIILISVLEIMFASIDKTVLEDANLFSNTDEVLALSDVANDLINRCYNARKQLYSHSNCSNSSVWRLYQCVSFNLLITLISANYQDSDMYNFFLFRNSKHEKSIWENIIDENMEISFPSFVSKTSYKYYVTNVRNRLNIEDRCSSISDRLSNVSLGASTQQCQRFDLIAFRKQVFPADHSTFISCYLEDDHLNELDCMPSICALILHTAAIGITSLSRENNQVMPEWMKSFNNSLRNVNLSNNCRAFIIKIIFNTENVFHVFAKFWLGPILYCVNKGACGHRVNHFYCQIVTMLTSWYDVATPDKNSYESNFASELVKLITTSIIGNKSDEANRNLQLLRLCVMRWNQCLEIDICNVFKELNICHLEGTDVNDGINILSLYLKYAIIANDHNVYEELFTIISYLFSSPFQSVFLKASELFGLFLKYVTENECCSTQVKHNENYVKLVKELLKNYFIQHDFADFALRLNKIIKYFPNLLDRELLDITKNICLLETLFPIHHIAISILLSSNSIVSLNLDILFESADTMDILLSNENSQLEFLQLIFAAITDDNFHKNLEDIIKKVMALLNNSNINVAQWAWKIFRKCLSKKATNAQQTIFADSSFKSILIDIFYNCEKIVRNEGFRNFIEIFPGKNNLFEILIFLLENLDETLILNVHTVKIILDLILEFLILKVSSENKLFIIDIFNQHHNADFIEFDSNEINSVNSIKISDLSPIISHQSAHLPNTQLSYEMILRTFQKLTQVDLPSTGFLFISILNALLLHNNYYEYKVKLFQIFSNIFNTDQSKSSYLYYLLEKISNKNKIITMESESSPDESAMKKRRYHDFTLEVETEDQQPPFKTKPL